MIRIMIVDDHVIIRHGLITILGLQPDLEIVGEAADGHEAVQRILDLRPDVVLLDLRLPNLSGIDVMRQIRTQADTRQIRFLVLTTYDTDAYITPALAAGATGYLLKDATSAELLRAIRALVGGGAVFEASITARVIGRINDPSADSLSAREVEIVRLVVTGASNKAIAAYLSVSENTIKYHMSHIMAKLGVQSRTEVTAIVLQRGLI